MKTRTILSALFGLLLAGAVLAQDCRNVYWRVAATPLSGAVSASARHRLVGRAAGTGVAIMAAETSTLLAELRLEVPNPLPGTPTFAALVRVYDVWKDCKAPIGGGGPPTPWGLAFAVTEEEAVARAGAFGTAAILRLPNYGEVAWPRFAIVTFSPTEAQRLGRNF